MYLVSAAHLLVCLVVLGAPLLLYRSGRRSLLAFVVVGFVLLDSIGLVIAPYVPLERIEYLTNPFFIINNGDIDLYVRQILAHWTFLSICVIGIMIELGRARSSISETGIPNRQRVRAFGTLLFITGIVVYVRYFVLGPGLGLLVSTRWFFFSTSEAVASRSLTRLVELGQGGYLASLAAAILLPVSAFLFLRGLAKGKWVLLGICVLLSLAWAVQTRQKAPVLYSLVAYGPLIALERIRGPRSFPVQRKAMQRLLRFGPISALGLAVVMYVTNFGQSITSAIQAAFVRLFLIPGAMETNFFAVFPQVYGFRGLMRSFSMPTGYLPSPGDVSIYDVAQAITGQRSSTNASFLAVSWSGAGYVGVLFASIALVVALTLVDRQLVHWERVDYLEMLALSLPSLGALVSGGVYNYVSTGGLTIPLLMLLVLKLAQRGEPAMGRGM